MIAIHALVGSNILVRVAAGLHEYIFIVLALRVTDADTMEIGIIYFLRFLPYLLLGPIAGHLSDTMDKRLLPIATNFGRVLVTIIFAVIITTGQLEHATLCVYGMAMMAFRAFYAPAFSSSIRFLVAPEKLRHVNSVNQAGLELGLIVGPATATLMATAGLGDVSILMVDALLVGIALSSLGLVGRIRSSETTEPRLDFGVLRLYADFYRINGIHRADPTNLTIVISGVCILFIGGALGILVPSFVKAVHGDERLVGIVMSSFSIGAVCGSLICSRYHVRMKPQDLMLYWLLYGGMLSLLSILGGSFVLLCFWSALIGMVGAFVDISIATIIQVHSDPHRVGSNFSFFSTVANTGEALSGPLVGVLAASFTLSSALVLVGGTVAAVAAVAYGFAVNRARLPKPS